ncbi:Gfo/Idh/MocA family protein [Phaeacidiphilus oryzae]|uniref:Gfo/Idh/MocA family protein n=1 Tax=Phaeacidiphilus oryzae TaxID=348818 RepID=UPI00056B9547|nr:Gfo/Idh/MocA family oxidoreductase [Phaeacidiphilus oryzae]
MAPVRVLCVGAGAMGRAWLRVLQDSAEAELVGVVDLDPAVAREAVVGLGRPGLPFGTDLLALAADTGAEAVVDVTVPAAHHPVTTAALFAGLPVLGEKPAAQTLAQALSLAATAEVTGELFMVSQSRRWNPQVFALRAMARELGTIGTMSHEFFRAPRFGGFRDRMAHPLLVDMAIHPFDTARFLLDAEPVAVNCQEWNPSWSWYAGAASASALFEMEGGARFAYNGSWCAPGAETSWNGEWRISGERGSARWDGEREPELRAEPAEPASGHSPYPVAAGGLAGALEAFCGALRAGGGAGGGGRQVGIRPMGEVHENAMSLAMVEAAVESAANGGRRVLLDAVLEHAHASALSAESHPAVREALKSWPTTLAALAPRAGAPRGGVGGSP